MSRDYQSPDYSLEDLRLAIEAMCKSLEGSGLIDEHEHPSAYSALLDTAKWMAELEGQEPVAWQHRNGMLSCRRPEGPSGMYFAPLYARPSPAEPVEMSPDFTDTARSALLWVLWHHQGGSSPVGQPIRYALGMDAHEHLSKHQVQEAKRWAALTKSESNDFRQARTAPPEPVNARLLEALKTLRDALRDHPEYAQLSEEQEEETGGDTAEFSYLVRVADEAIAAAEAQQERLLQDMHDAGREIDRVMAEPAPKAVRLTDEEVDICFDGSDGTRIGAARAIETAVLRKNGIEVAE